MKRSIIATILFAVSFCTAARAEDAKQNDLTGTIFAYADAIHANGKDRSEYWVKPFLKYKGLADIGMEFGYGPAGDYTNVRIYGGPVIGKFALFGGYAFDSNKKDHAVGGFKYVDRFDKINVCVDSRIYAAVSEKARSYWDTLTEVTYRIGMVRLGGNVIFDKYLAADDSHNYVLAGPIVYVDITKHVQAFGRFAGDWSMTAKGTERGTRARLGLMITF